MRNDIVISDDVLKMAKDAEKELVSIYNKCDDICFSNTRKVLNAFINNNVSFNNFSGSSVLILLASLIIISCSSLLICSNMSAISFSLGVSRIYISCSSDFKLIQYRIDRNILTVIHLLCKHRYMM